MRFIAKFVSTNVQRVNRISVKCHIMCRRCMWGKKYLFLNFLKRLINFIFFFSSNYTNNQKTETTTTAGGVVPSTTEYSCSLSCTPGTIKATVAGLSATSMISCCSTNYCNTGTATTDTNTLWCNFGEKGSLLSGTQSCSTTCMVRKNDIRPY